MSMQACAQDTSDGEGLWYTEDFPESAWLHHLGFLAARYRGNPRVVGFDIRNEIRSTDSVTPTWGSGGTDWALAASKGSRQVLDANPDMLLFISGLEQLDMDLSPTWYPRLAAASW